MSRQTRILAAVFGVVLLYVLFSNFVYPWLLKPLFHIDDRIAVRQQEFNKLQELEDQVERARKEYVAMVARVGSSEVNKVVNELRVRVNELVERHQLRDYKLTPGRAREDKKKGFTTTQLTVTGVGKLKGVVEFLKDIAELPQLARIGNAAIYPVSGRGDDARSDLNFRFPVEVLVLPHQRVVGRIDEEDLRRPDDLPPRHQDRDYAQIWTRKPFSEPIPLKVEAGPNITKKQGQPAKLAASASGGEPPISFKWDPTDRLDNAATDKPTVDTSSGYTQTYTVTVTDSEGATASDTVTVTVAEPPAPPQVKPEPVVDRPPPPPVDPRSPDAKYMQLCMTLSHTDGTQRIEELMVYNNRSKQSEYFKAGDTFNGGELVGVHPRGAVVRRKNDYFLYPVGTWLDQEVNVRDETATVFPELMALADRHRKAAETNSGLAPQAEPELPTSQAGEGLQQPGTPGGQPPNASGGGTPKVGPDGAGEAPAPGTDSQPPRRGSDRPKTQRARKPGSGP